MRLSRFYTERTNLTIGSSVKLADSEINHIRKVLRLEKGDQIVVFNGEKEFLARLILAKKDIVKAKIIKLLKSVDFSSGSSVEFTLFQGLLKAGKMDLILKKTTELGVESIVPIECEYSQTKAEKIVTKIDRWQKITLSASKQSERIKIPEILPPIKFDQVKELVKEFDVFYMFTLPGSRAASGFSVEKLSNKPISGAKKIAYFIGPEGGFSPQEHKIALDSGMKLVNFLDTILTSENAAISALAVLKFIYGNVHDQ